jgi:alanine racemase
MIDLDEFLAACGGRLLAGERAGDEPAARSFSAFAYDSRIVAPGELFVAVITPTGDGHDYIAEAIGADAAGVLCSRPPAAWPSGLAVIQVPDTQEALTAYARAVLAERGPEVIGVTGSMGKTSAKEAIYAVLATAGPVFRSQGNYNGRFGLPIALGRLEPGQRLAVLEMAADSRGEIAHLAALARPRVGVVTAVAPAHGQYLGTLDEIAAEKGALPAALPAEGTAVLNADDPRVRAMAARTAAQVITYGLAADADYRGEDVAVAPQGTQVTVCHAGERIRLSIPLIGTHHALTMLAAAAVGRLYGLTWAQIVAGLAAVDPLPGRTRLLAGINGSQLLDRKSVV